jgi:hypothetical protein
MLKVGICSLQKDPGGIAHAAHHLRIAVTLSTLFFLALGLPLAQLFQLGPKIIGAVHPCAEFTQ